ncbi:MAG: restriction endonuclease [Bacteroidales bacterium]|nr:restriction endonuclease [Bacteroidales bacterium]
MRILVEGYGYDASEVEEVLDGLQPLQTAEGKIYLGYVGYFYNRKVQDCVFILPKVLMDENELVFRHIKPEDLIHVEKCTQLRGEEPKFLYEFAVWIYRAITVFNQERPGNDIIYYRRILQAGSGRKHRTETYLDVIISLVRFNRDNQDFFMSVLKNIHSGLNKINWTRTISRKTALVQGGEATYINPVNKKRQINFDEELLVIFFSILNYVNQTYGFSVHLTLGYDLITGKKFKTYLKGYGKKRLKQIKYKYFSDKALQIWDLCYAFFDRAYPIAVNAENQEYLLAKNFNIVFEAMIDELIGDKNLPPELDKLKNQEDGKQVDHIYSWKGLTTHEEDKPIFYIGDSKYYKLGNPVSRQSVYKQWTYARNIIQWNLDLFLDNLPENEPLRQRIPKYRDDETEGYNIVPNFFISATMDEDLKYSEDIKEKKGNKEREGGEDEEEKPNYYLSRQFENRLFDRDTLLVYHYDVNFLFIVALYVRNSNSQKAAWRKKVRNQFRDSIREILISHYDFYAMTPLPGTNAEEYFHNNFQKSLGKVFKPYSDPNLYSLALDCKDPDGDNKAVKEELERYFVVKVVPIGNNPSEVYKVAQQMVIPTGKATDMVLCIMFDKLHEIIKKAGTFTQIAEGLTLSESTMQLVEGFASTKWIVLHNKKDYYMYEVTSGPRFAPQSSLFPNTIVKQKDAEMYIVFDVLPFPVKGIRLDSSKLAVAKGDKRISYYTTFTHLKDLLPIAEP